MLGGLADILKARQKKHVTGGLKTANNNFKKNFSKVGRNFRFRVYNRIRESVNIFKTTGQRHPVVLFLVADIVDFGGGVRGNKSEVKAMANEKNLIPGGHIPSKEEASKGGKKSAETRRLKGAIKRALESSVNDNEIKEVFENFGIEEGSKDYATAIACAGVLKAAKGDLSWASFIRDTIGEKPKDEVDLGGGVVILAGSDEIVD